ncbi:MAG: hypothetical protein ACOC8B_03115 [Gemmatimonadota bacterium]
MITFAGTSRRARAAGRHGRLDDGSGHGRGIAARFRAIRPEVRPSRVPGFEHFYGFGVLTLPFDSGHVLGLRVFPQNDFAPFVAVWHRTPTGEWSMYVDAPEHDVFCPRFFGPILHDSRPASITVDWTAPDELRVRMDRPMLDWTMRVTSSARTRLVNAVMPRLPLGLYRRRPVLSAIRAIADRVLGFGRMDLRGPLPNGQVALVQPKRVYLVSGSRALLDGADLGTPVRAASNPTTGAFRWPARGALAEGDLYIRKDDPREYERLIRRFRRTSAASTPRPSVDSAT